MTDQRPLNILVISYWYPNRTNPTLGNFNEKFALAAAGYNKVSVIHVVADESMSAAEEWEEDVTTSVHVQRVYFKKGTSKNIFAKFSRSLRYLNYYRKALLKRNKQLGKMPDLVHVHVLFPAGIIALFMRWFYGIPYVVTEHWTGYLPGSYVHQSVYVRWLSRLAARKASKLLPVTHNLKDAMIGLGFRNSYEVVPNVFDVSDFYLPQTKEFRPKKQILHVSSLRDDHKNISGLLRAIHRLSGIRKDFELHIVGDGDASPHIKLAGELGLQDSFVRFSGEMSPTGIAAAMRDSDFFVLFSNYENLPCVIVEAFASGLPVISTRVGGISEHLDESKGILIGPKDEDALVHALNTMLDNHASYNKPELNKYAGEQFSYESVGRRLNTIYREVLGMKNNNNHPK
jgi:glycosyltransferase involved in cell wall biosynthesis